MIRLVILAALVVVIGGGLFITYTQPALLPPQLQTYAPQVKSTVDSGLNTAHTLLSNSKNAQPAVMGVKTESSRIFQEDTAGKPIHQKAMEFTQYQYCKMIVKSYEEEQSKDSKSSDSSSSTTVTTTLTPAPEKEK